VVSTLPKKNRYFALPVPYLRAITNNRLVMPKYIATYAANYSVDADYYPFAKVLRGYSLGAREKYMSTHHERDEETGGLAGLDYRGARMYDSEIGRFLGVDALATSFYSESSYMYSGSNPVSFLDRDGNKKLHFNSEGNYTGVTHDNWWHNTFIGARGVQNTADGKTNTFKFASPTDADEIINGTISKLYNVSEGQVETMLYNAGAFNAYNRKKPASYLLQEGGNGGAFDFKFSNS
jgi:RHS repeat-associated protein